MKLCCSNCWILRRGLEGKVNGTLSSGRGSLHDAAPLTNRASPCVFIQHFLLGPCFGCSRMKVIVIADPCTHTFLSIDSFMNSALQLCIQRFFSSLLPTTHHCDEDNLCLSDEVNACSMSCTCVFDPCQQSRCRLTEYILWMSYYFYPGPF